MIIHGEARCEIIEFGMRRQLMLKEQDDKKGKGFQDPGKSVDFPRYSTRDLPFRVRPRE